MSDCLWACCNVGASSPKEYGGYYAWGEVEEKNVYNDLTSPYCTGVDNDGDGWYDVWDASRGCYFKYAVWQNIGNYYTMPGPPPREDGNGFEEHYDFYDIAGTQYDVAYVKWGGSWVMPNYDQMIDLTGFLQFENDGRFFLPFAGLREDYSLKYAGESGFYMSSTCDSTNVSLFAWEYYVSDVVNHILWVDGYFSTRSLGLSVRPVWIP